ncbi:MAG: hypothetical protein JSS61_05430 [Verrucomicrobia bacterium]|nr:hypothetical protein [Verrucomicrobiota bacterium]
MENKVSITAPEAKQLTPAPASMAGPALLMLIRLLSELINSQEEIQLAGLASGCNLNQMAAVATQQSGKKQMLGSFMRAGGSFGSGLTAVGAMGFNHFTNADLKNDLETARTDAKNAGKFVEEARNTASNGRALGAAAGDENLVLRAMNDQTKLSELIGPDGKLTAEAQAAIGALSPEERIQVLERANSQNNRAMKNEDKARKSLQTAESKAERFKQLADELAIKPGFQMGEGIFQKQVSDIEMGRMIAQFAEQLASKTADTAKGQIDTDTNMIKQFCDQLVRLSQPV